MRLRRMRCRHGLRREDVFVLLMALVEANEAGIVSRPAPDLSMWLEPQPSRAPSGRPRRRSAGKRRDVAANADVRAEAVETSRRLRPANDPFALAAEPADPGK